MGRALAVELAMDPGRDIVAQPAVPDPARVPDEERELFELGLRRMAGRPSGCGN